MTDLSFNDVALRIGLSLAIGLILGFEREQHGRAAGMRTTMLVCVASAIAMVLSQHLFWESAQGAAGPWRPDPARLAAGVLAGMGFLGAGVIMRQDNAIHGVTTAALLWFAAILGMAFGSGYLLLGFAGFCIAFLALFILPRLEALIPSDRYAHFSVTSTLKGPSQEKVRQVVEGLGLKATLKASSLEYDNEKRSKTMQFDLKIKNSRMALCQAEAVAKVSRLAGVKQVRWH